MIQPQSRTLAVVAGLLSTLLVHGQDKPSRLTFEVASIKPAKPGQRGGGIKALPGGQEYSARNVPLKLIISLMYKVPFRQISGGPGWLDTEFYDIEAKADRSYSLDDLHVMFQNLLADEFKLRFHKETRMGNVYALLVEKSGSKMKVNETEQDFKIPLSGGRGEVTATRVSMEHFCWWLGQVLQADERPVIDQTGLDKNYDFTLTFAPMVPPNFKEKDAPADLDDHPTIFEALKKQLGLRLEPQKGPVTYYVIDRVERPATN